MTKKKLGRGLSVLLGDTMDDDSRVMQLGISSIHPNPWQPRQNFDEKSLASLAESIKKEGLLQPIVVRKTEEGTYEIVSGERRFRAASLAGLETIPAISGTYSDQAMAEMALIENLQREDLNPVEEGMAYKTLIETYGLTQEEVGEKVGRSRPYITNILRLQDLPEEVKGLLSDGSLTAGQARPLLSLSSGAEQVSLARRIVKEGLSARKIEEIIRDGKKEPKKKAVHPASAYIRSMEESLGLSVGTKVRIQIGKGKNAHKGTISISFKNDEEFQRITELLKKEN